MKKILVTILTFAMLTTTVTAFANGGPQGGPMGKPGNGLQGGHQMQQQAVGKPSGEKPADVPEKPTGEKPADAPEEPSDLTGEKPADIPEKPADEKPANAPEKPAGEKGQQPADRQQGPKMIDFDAMVTRGVISQETREKIQAYMDTHKPEGQPQVAPTEGQQPPEKPEGELPTDGEKPADAPELPAGGREQRPDLLSELLNAGVITQTEYDGLSATVTVD